MQALPLSYLVLAADGSDDCPRRERAGACRQHPGHPCRRRDDGPRQGGPFSPAVRFGRCLVSRPCSRFAARRSPYHSQYINEFCADFGVPKKMNQALIKKAKVVGSDLGFLS